MSSMTDVIFLLLIFFMITSTMVSPNAIKVLLPQGKQQTSAKPLTRVIIDKELIDRIKIRAAIEGLTIRELTEKVMGDYCPPAEAYKTVGKK